MKIEVKIPSPGESVTDVIVSKWFHHNGDIVKKNAEIAELESEKATLTLNAPESGKIFHLVGEGELIKVGEIACTIDTDYAEPENVITKTVNNATIETKTKNIIPVENNTRVVSSADKKSEKAIKITPLARHIAQHNNISEEELVNNFKRIGKNDVLNLSSKKEVIPSSNKNNSNELLPKKEPLSPLRKKLAQRLVAAKNQTAMLTTFNEADMSKVMAFKNQYQQQFLEKYGIKPGFMSFFSKAVCIAMQQFPAVNSTFENDSIIYYPYCHLGIAVQTSKGLMVPVIRNAEKLDIASLEQAIQQLAEKARKLKISLEDLEGGTFTITNGGIFGSLLSTPLLNFPQAGILGMHAITNRPVVIDNKIEIRPMMYIALSYDHRIIDGKEAVGFLSAVKDLIENPLKMLYSGSDPEKILLGL